MFIHTYTENAKPWEKQATEWHVAVFLSTKENRIEIMNWCYDTFGPPVNPKTGQTRWKNGITWGEAIFKQKKDLEWFVLRWS